ncbi:LysR family transcriptional regulator [Nocardia terpenica]|nr:LysR family transcriptional regulator [Nocardia terpenica]MBF6105255.1 LysR family transcriptional regulator [Nocardia terpenica]MBF6113275.1 LysR family transcriptional regulator [Nocardia terpenica]MBF6119405.1 LysR family transcriptional regulator [Nocardia terpenica]MBF6153053.1 LysR family transcriptional regulator [Nocardia terpenica]
MSGMELRELEAFLAVAEELHFGRAGERLYVSQSRISQLLRALENRIGATLVERTSRRVRLTPLGEQLFPELRTAYDQLHATIDAARDLARGLRGVLRIGFQGSVDEQTLNAVTTFRDAYPDSMIELVEIPYADPFGPLRRREVNAAMVLLPVEESDLVVAHVLPGRPQVLMLPTGHPLTRRAALSAADLTKVPLIGMTCLAPEYWRDVQTPPRTPDGRAIPGGPKVRTMQEAIAAVAAGRGGLLLCRTTAELQRRPDVTFVPVHGVPDSHLGLIWQRELSCARVETFARILAATPDPGLRAVM